MLEVLDYEGRCRTGEPALARLRATVDRMDFAGIQERHAVRASQVDRTRFLSVPVEDPRDIHEIP